MCVFFSVRLATLNTFHEWAESSHKFVYVCIWNGIWIWRAYYNVVVAVMVVVAAVAAAVRYRLLWFLFFFIDSKRNFHAVPFETEFDCFMRFACGKLIISEIRFYYSFVHYLHPLNQIIDLLARLTYASIGMPELTILIHNNLKRQNISENLFWHARTTPASLPLNPFHFWPRLERTNWCNWPENDSIHCQWPEKTNKKCVSNGMDPELDGKTIYHITKCNLEWFDFETVT